MGRWRVIWFNRLQLILMIGMGERISTLFPLALLFFLVALTYWLDRAVQTPDAPRIKLLRHDPDYTAEKLLATRMDVNGRVRDTLHAVRMAHFPHDDSTEIEQPRFVSYAQGAPLSITAQHALVSSNGGNLYFRENVRATREPYPDTSALVITTEYLHVLPDDNIAKTDQSVTIRDDNMTINAVGMELNSETRILKLNASVRGVYNDANARGAGNDQR